MKVKTNSVHAFMYKFTYKSNLPKNLCPYFWKLVLAAAIFIPNALLQLPVLIVSIFDKSVRNEDCGGKRTYGFAIYFVGALLAGYGTITYNWFKWLLDCYSYDRESATIGGGVNFIILCIVAYFLIKAGIDKIRYAMRGEHEREEPTPSIVAEFVKAKYHRYCPQLEWDKNVEDEI